MSALQAARLNVRRSGGDMGMLDGLHSQQTAQTIAASSREDDSEAQEVATSNGPFSLAGNQRSSQNGVNGSRSRS
jgi:hypothetical protein